MPGTAKRRRPQSHIGHLSSGSCAPNLSVDYMPAINGSDKPAGLKMAQNKGVFAAAVGARPGSRYAVVQQVVLFVGQMRTQEFSLVCWLREG